MVIPNDFDTLLDYFSFSMWIFHGSTCAALLYFRYKLPDYPRPIKVTLIDHCKLNSILTPVSNLTLFSVHTFRK